MEKLTIFDVANVFLKLVDRDKDNYVTPLKMQKILYYAQGYHLAMFDKELFEADFQAWSHGPANPGIYHKYKKYSFNFIPAIEETIPTLTEETLNFLSDIWQTFGIYDGKYLEELTHKETPWILARKGLGYGEPCENVITKESMKEFFKTKLNEEPV